MKSWSDFTEAVALGAQRTGPTFFMAERGKHGEWLTNPIGAAIEVTLGLDTMQKEATAHHHGLFEGHAITELIKLFPFLGEPLPQGLRAYVGISSCTWQSLIDWFWSEGLFDDRVKCVNFVAWLYEGQVD